MLVWLLWAAFWPGAQHLVLHTPKAQVHDPNNKFFCRVPSLHTVSGTGLTTARAGQRTFFHVHWAPGFSPSSLYVWAANGEYMFAGEVSVVNGTLMGSYVADQPGQYDLHVEEFWVGKYSNPKHALAKRCGSDQHVALPGSPFRLTVTGEPSMSITSPHALPRCLTRDGWHGTGNGMLEGGWVSARLAAHRGNVLRQGWVYQPRNCAFEILPYEDLLAASHAMDKWIVVMGNSIQRGLFLSLLDLLLQPHQMVGFQGSITSKCWGWSDFKLNRLRVTYADWRILVGKANEIVCHGNRVAVPDGTAHQRNGWALLESLFRKGEEWPNVIVVEIPTLDLLRQLLKHTPPSWQGRYFVLPADSVVVLEGHAMFFRNLQPIDAKLLQSGKEMHAQDPRVVVYFTLPVLAGVAHDLEAPGKYQSQHYHRECNESGLQGPVTICGPEREMVSQMLLGLLLGPKQELASLPRPSTPDSITFCHDCPAELLPFHINPDPKPLCVTSDGANFTFNLLPRNTPTAMVQRHVTVCPAACMRRPRVGVQRTRQSVVDVRHCKVKA